MKNEVKTWHRGRCHCEAVTFKVRAPSHVELTDCNCSICKMTGFLHLIVAAEDFRLLTGANNIKTYTFNTHAAKHTFCRTCGIKPFYTPRSHPDGISVNFRCIDQSGFNTVSSKGFDGQNWEGSISNLKGA